MAKSNIKYAITSYGIYDQWNNDSKSLPKIQKFTTEVPAAIDVEFGFIINIKKGKGKKITFCIFHPDIPDDEGNILPPFSGEMYIKNSDWHFYLGDTIWAPIKNKLGDWRMTIECDNTIIADKTFNVCEPDEFLEAKFWKRAGY